MAAIAPAEPTTIRRLDQATVNRIAAGEVIHRPANALKELLENSIDAGSSNIAVVAKGGGLKLLQITDNGCGIKKDDLGIAVERFTTSKLREYDDLQSIGTFGFRGEALASISHVAHLCITTMTADSPCAYKAHYSDSKLVPAKEGDTAEPRACAGVKGTVITVEDLFYNVPSRRQALKNPTDEYAKILDVVSRYALRFPHVGFTCKKMGDNTADVKTRPNSSVKDNIRNIHGAALARELLEMSEESTAPKVKVEAHLSNPNYSMKRLTLVLFINGRLVECGPVRRCLESVYSPYLPKGSHPFVYMSLEFPPESLDVNVHPTKNEVRFVDEELVIDFLQEALEKTLLGSNASRTFYTQTLMPGAPEAEQPEAREKPGKGAQNVPPPKSMVRTTAATEAGQIEAYITRLPPTTDKAQSRVKSKRQLGDPAGGMVPAVDHRGGAPPAAEEEVLPPTIRKKARTRKDCGLTSVRTLIAKTEDKAHEGLTELMRDHAFVGSATDTLALVQHGTRLFLVDLPLLTKEAVYQSCLRRFGDLDRIELMPPAPVSTLVRAVLDTPDAGWSPEDGDKDEIAEFVTDLLVKQKGEMLHAYFGMRFDPASGTLQTLPELLDHYVPNLKLLPMFLLRLAIQVDWTSEMRCFETIASELAEFYMVREGATTAECMAKELRAHAAGAVAARQRGASNAQACFPQLVGGLEQDGEIQAWGAEDCEGASARPQGDGHIAISKKEGDRECCAGGEQSGPMWEEDGTIGAKRKTTEEGMQAGTTGSGEWRWCVQHVLFPAMRYLVLPPRSFANDGTVVQLVCTSQLYKVFERC